MIECYLFCLAIYTFISPLTGVLQIQNCAIFIKQSTQLANLAKKLLRSQSIVNTLQCRLNYFKF